MSEMDKMSEISELRQLVAQQMREFQTISALYQKLVADLIGELARVYAPPGDNGVVVAAAAMTAAAGATATKADKINEMSLALWKGHRVKNLSEMSESLQSGKRSESLQSGKRSESSQSGSSRPHSERSSISSQSGSSRPHSESSDKFGGSDESSHGGPRQYVKRNRRRLGHYTRECPDETIVEAVEVKDES